jgi:transcription antitermination factor NusG
MTAEPFEPEYNFSKGQRVRIVEGPFTAFVGRVTRNFLMSVKHLKKNMAISVI